MTTATTNLTAADVFALHTVLSACSQVARVRWLDDTHPDGINEGTARHIVASPTNLGFLRGDEDVRDGYVRITTTTGWERFLPVREAMELVKIGGFALDG